jgi:hypothetical protein
MALNEALTERLAWEIENAGKGAMAIMLAGGNTPLHAYQALGTRKLTPSGTLELLFSDERYVPATSEASNFRAARPLVESLGLPGERVLRVRTELPLDRAVEDYERRLRALVKAGTAVRLGILGLGADGRGTGGRGFELFHDAGGAVGRLVGHLLVEGDADVVRRHAVAVHDDQMSGAADALAAEGDAALLAALCAVRGGIAQETAWMLLVDDGAHDAMLLARLAGVSRPAAAALIAALAEPLLWGEPGAAIACFDEPADAEIDAAARWWRLPAGYRDGLKSHGGGDGQSLD